jgi:hypothetical protein
MFNGLWETFFGSGKSEKVTVQLVAEADGRTLPGFHHGGLTLIANKGDTFEKILYNFNAYRGPDSQIKKLFTQDGVEVPLQSVINAPVRVFVRKI